MAADQEAIETFMSITGVDEATAIQKLEEHQGNLNEAINAHFGEGDTNITRRESFTPFQAEDMDIYDPVPFQSYRHPRLPFSSLLDPNFTRPVYDRGDASNRSPFVSHPREVREIPIEVNDTGATGHSVGAPIIGDVTGSEHEHGPEVRGTVIIDEDYDSSFPNSQTTRAGGHLTRYNFRNSDPSAPAIVDEPDDGNYIEEEMLRAAIEASKQDAEMSNQHVEGSAPELVQSHPEDAELAHAVSLSLQTAEREKSLREQEGKVRPSGVAQISDASDEIGRLSTNGRQSFAEVGNTTLPDETEDAEDLPLVRRMRRRVFSAPVDVDEDIEEVDHTPSSPPPANNVLHQKQIGNDFPSEENDRQLAAKEASLPQEPAPDDANAVTLLVRMPDGSRRGRRFLKSVKLQSLFDFIDVGRVVKPGSYRLVRPYPRRAFGDGERSSTLDELGLSSKQEALFLELI